MDWYKAKVGYTLYSDFNDKQFRAYFNLMALTAQIESMPTKDQMLKVCHYKTLDSLETYFVSRSTTLQEVLNKVLIDVQDVLNTRSKWKEKKQQQRGFTPFVQGDVSDIEKNKNKNKKDLSFNIDDLKLKLRS